MQASAVALIPAQVSGKRFRRADVRSEVERDQQFAVCRCKPRIELQRPLVGGAGRRWLAEVQKPARQFTVCPGQIPIRRGRRAAWVGIHGDQTFEIISLSRGRPVPYYRPGQGAPNSLYPEATVLAAAL